MIKKALAVVLVIALSLSALCLPVYSADVELSPKAYTLLDNAINLLAGGIAAMIKTPAWENAEDYKNDSFNPGMSKDKFIDTPAANAVWSLGYGSASLQTGNELDGTHYVGGSLSVTKKLVTEVLDDQRVRTVAVSDGRGITLFATLDCFGLVNNDVNTIRERFMEYADEKGLDINSINVSTLHQHSCVDTFGMNGDIVSALFTSCLKNIFGIKLESGQNEEYMEHLFTVTVDSMKQAVEGMETGKLYFGTVNAKKYIRDKRDPQVIDENLNRLRFVPDAENSKETWLVNGAIHCVGNGAAGTTVTGDYPYYMEEYINKNAGANFFYIQGAELAISSQYNDENGNSMLGLPDGASRYDQLAAYGKILGELVCTISNDKEVAPILNIASKEFIMDVDNNILLLAAKAGLIINNVLKAGLGKYKIVTEIGYAEFGTDLAVSIVPGELAPEIAFGGAMTAEESWSGEAWNYPTFESLSGNRKLLVFGLTNDQIGYILTDNSWHSILNENEELVATGKHAGSAVATAYCDLVKSVA